MRTAPALTPGQETTLRLDTIRRMAGKLTPAQAKKLAELSADWRREEHGWKAGTTFHRLSDMGLCEMQDRRVSGGDVMTGPGNTSVYRWFTRRTELGTAVFIHRYNAQTIRRTEAATR